MFVKLLHLGCLAYTLTPAFVHPPRIYSLRHRHPHIHTFAPFTFRRLILLAHKRALWCVLVDFVAGSGLESCPIRIIYLLFFSNQTL